MTAVLSVLVPACNEARFIGGCLAALLASDPVPGHAIEIIVIANGCTDQTAAIAQRYADGARARGWRLRVIEQAQGSKIAALNTGDEAATGRLRVYLDADVRVGATLLPELAVALTHDAPRYATGTPRIAPPESRLTALYARFWARVPFTTGGAPGFGVFAVNAAGRARWAEYPDVIADDTFVRLNFAPSERVQVAAPYVWPMAEGLARLVRVRRRQDRGTAEIAARFPQLVANEGKPPADLTALARADPPGFAVYATVAALVRLGRPVAARGWVRGR